MLLQAGELGLKLASEMHRLGCALHDADCSCIRRRRRIEPLDETQHATSCVVCSCEVQHIVLGVHLEGEPGRWRDSRSGLLHDLQGRQVVWTEVNQLRTCME